jgi:hypothetical protein
MWWFLVIAAILAVLCIAIAFALAVPGDKHRDD